MNCNALYLKRQTEVYEKKKKEKEREELQTVHNVFKGHFPKRLNWQYRVKSIGF